MFSTIRGLISDPVGMLIQLAITIPAIIIALSVHEFFHAVTADRLGDFTPRSQGRVTLNPKAHIDPWGLLTLFLVGFGWGRPVQINERNLRPRRWGSIAVSLAGPMSNLCMCFVGCLLQVVLQYVVVLNYQSLPGWIATALSYVAVFFNYFAILNANLCIFNLLPIPPLDGFHIAKMLLSSPKNLSMWWQFERYGFIVLFVLVMLGVFQLIISPISTFITNGFTSSVAAFMRLIFGSAGL